MVLVSQGKIDPINLKQYDNDPEMNLKSPHANSQRCDNSEG